MATAACQPEDKSLAESMLRNISPLLPPTMTYSLRINRMNIILGIRQALHSVNAVGQECAGGVPAMCDGVTQRAGWHELSLLSREVIAMSAAVSLSQYVLTARYSLGVADKIVQGLAMAALFGHLPAVFCSVRLMASGLPNKEKVRDASAICGRKSRRNGAAGVEAASYHAPGTCTFYGTANTNQMVVGLHGNAVAGFFVCASDAPLRRH